MRSILTMGVVAGLAAGLLTLGSCADEGGDSGGGGQVISNSSTITSTVLGSSAIVLPSGATETAIACSGSVSNCTPTNLEGRIFAASAMLSSSSGSTSSNYAMTFLADSLDVINDPSQTTHPEGTTTFNLGTPTVFSGNISIPTEAVMPSGPIINRIETYFDYIDATVALTGTSGVDGTYVIRQVFRKTATATDITSGQTMQLGDKLIRANSETTFRWCTSTDCTNTTRPTSGTLQDAALLEIDAANDTQEGNPDYALYSIDLTSNLDVTYAQISDTTRLWTLDYQIANAVGFTSTPSTFTDEKDIVTAFKLEFGCNTETCTTSDNRIKATLSIGEAGSATSSSSSVK